MTPKKEPKEVEQTPPDLTEQDWKILKVLVEQANDPTPEGKIAIGLLLQKVLARIG